MGNKETKTHLLQRPIVKFVRYELLLKHFGDDLLLIKGLILR